MKKSLAVNLLEHLAITGTSLMISSLFAPYSQSLGRGLREAERIMASCPHNFSGRSKYTVSNTLSRLKGRGLIVRSGSRKKAVWRITKMGKRHFKARNEEVLPPDDGKIRLAVFDVPERERDKRDWLRTRLLACEYYPFQKSVWMGTRPLPKELFDELRERGLGSYVHVVSLEGAAGTRKV